MGSPHPLLGITTLDSALPMASLGPLTKKAVRSQNRGKGFTFHTVTVFPETQSQSRSLGFICTN